MVATFTDLLRARAENAAGAGFRFLRNGSVADAFTYAELDQAARSIAAQLQASGVGHGDPVLLLYAPGLDFVRALFGCFYAGVTAVPVYPPNPARLARTLPRLRAIARDVQAKVALTTADIEAVAAAMLPLAPELAATKWISTDRGAGAADAWKPVTSRPTDVAILQYTSGSTREPRGVALTHANVLHNQRLIQEGFAHEPGHDNMVVSWLPVYHDMGLIGMTLQPIFLGGSSVQMAPMEFLQSPLRWLTAISEFRATTTGAPNFAFELCCRKVTDEQLAKLDLSSWRVAYCGAEPIRAETLDKFATKMERAGFKRSSFLPCYGLAEATLIVTGTSRPEGAVTRTVDSAALREGRVAPPSGARATTLVGCGRVLGDQELAIVADGQRRGADELGEIWLRGDSIAGSYWGHPEDSAATFAATLPDGKGPFLRTGDLGFVDASGELFIVGRVKDLVIVRGVNYYPHDLEAVAEGAWPSLRPGCAAAFALDGDEAEQVVLVCEYDAKSAKEGVSWDVVVTAVRAAIAAELELAVHAVVIVTPGQVPKTPSGKVQRRETQRRFLAGELEVLHEARTNTSAGEPVVADRALETADDIQRFLTSWLSERLQRAITADEDFAMMGLDSLDAVRMLDALGEVLGCELNAILTLDYPSAAMLAAHLASLRKPA